MNIKQILEKAEDIVSMNGMIIPNWSVNGKKNKSLSEITSLYGIDPKEYVTKVIKEAIQEYEKAVRVKLVILVDFGFTKDMNLLEVIETAEKSLMSKAYNNSIQKRKELEKRFWN